MCPCIMAASTRSVIEVSITSTLVAGILDILRKIQFKLSVRKEHIRSNLRGGATSVLKSKIGNVFSVTKVRALNAVQKLIYSSQLLLDETYIKPSCNNKMTLGSIIRHHLSMYQDRKKSGNDFNVFPTDNTIR